MMNFYRLEKIRAERENEMFPDEMDTPMDQAARVRFQRFVGISNTNRPI